MKALYFIRLVSFPNVFNAIGKHLDLKLAISKSSLSETTKKSMVTIQDGWYLMTGKAFPRKNGIKEFKHDVYGRQQTAKITFDFLFFSCNP